MAALPAVRAALRSIDPHQPIYAIDTLAARFQSTVMMRRMVSAVLLVLAGVALLLAAMGIYGIVAFMASQREREFGIRLALGASARQLVIELLRRTSRRSSRSASASDSSSRASSPLAARQKRIR